jgi:hypothetical protein
MATSRDFAAQVRMASGINILLGIWLIISPWVFGYASVGPAAMWNSVVVGALVLIMAATRFASPHTAPGLSWTNLILGLWTIAAPWIYVYDNLGNALWDNVATGLAIVAVAIWAASATAAEARDQHRPIQQM